MKLCTSIGLTAWFSAYAVGTVPIRISMISPMPFCPSFEPWKKLTPVQVSTISARIGHGGGSLSFGCFVQRRELEQPLRKQESATPASAKPSSGEISSAFKTLIDLLPVQAGGAAR